MSEYIKMCVCTQIQIKHYQIELMKACIFLHDSSYKTKTLIKSLSVSFVP